MQGLQTIKTNVMKKKTMIRILLLAVPAGLLLFAYALYQYNRKPADTGALASVAAVNADSLTGIFSRAESFANGLYLGKVLEVNGMLKSEEKDEQGNITLILGDMASQSSVRCLLLQQPALPEKLPRRGATVLVKGICTGYRADDMGLGADVLLNRCVLSE